MKNHIRNYGQVLLATTTVALAALICVNAMAADSDAGTRPKATAKVKLPKYKNEDFYKDGKFQVEKAKQAYLGLMAKHGYPVPESLRTNFWASDFGLGDFVNAGMGGVVWINHEKQGYFGHEIYLLPGQMIVEHGHEATAKGKPKMESWHVRNGSIYTFGEEGGPIPAGLKLAKSQEKYITVQKCYEMQMGDIRTLNRVGAMHFMVGGPQGAIVTEYGTFHDGEGLRFTNPGVKF
jgi:D-lyxose ketol-isomerase